MHALTVRPAQIEDHAAVEALLEASYPVLLARAYEPQLLARALPALTRANPKLLKCGTWYLAESPEGELLGCGGFAVEEPPGTGRTFAADMGHIRHFATHPQAVRRGVGRALLERSLTDARAGGLRELEALSTLYAEPFYAALGFVALDAVELEIPTGLDGAEEARGSVSFPAIVMRMVL